MALLHGSTGIAMECPQTIPLVHAYFTRSLAIPVHSNFDGLTGPHQFKGRGHLSGRFKERPPPQAPVRSGGATVRLTTGTVQMLARYGFVGPLGRRVNSLNLWATLGVIEGQPAVAVRQLFRDRILYGSAPWELGAWTDFCNELRVRLRLPEPAADKIESLAAFLAFNDAEALSSLPAGLGGSTKQTTINGVTIRLGSIHSVKGRTVDAILVVQSEVYRGPAADQQVMDLETVLPHAFGIANTDFSTSEARLAAATNVFVGVTRTRELLALALRRDAASDVLLEAARQQGWHVRDLT